MIYGARMSVRWTLRIGIAGLCACLALAPTGAVAVAGEGIEALKQVAVHMIVGKADLETWEITHREGGKFFMPGANSAGKNRPERLESLRRSFEAAGVNATLDVVDNVPHDGLKCVGQVQDFLAAALRKMRHEGN